MNYFFISFLLSACRRSLAENQGETGITFIKDDMKICLNQSRVGRYKFEKVYVSSRNIFDSVNITVSTKSEETFQLLSDDESKYNAKYSLWLIWLFSKADRHKFVSKKISPFQDFYFNISFRESDHHTIDIRTSPTRVNKYQLGMFFAGIGLFFTAKYLSRSTLFHYSSGVSIGVLMSWMIILIIMYKIIPYKRVMATLLASGTAFGFYFMESIMDTIYHLMVEYPYELLGVTSVFALLSMALIYYFGPPSSERGLNILQWSLQVIASYLIYQSSYCREFSVTAVVFVFTAYCVRQFVSTYSIVVKLIILVTPRKWLSWYYRPRKRVYLTQQQYEEEGVIETERALRELSAYCNSPKCDSWKVVSKLKDPKKFATFLMDGQQFTSAEIDAYESFDCSEELLNMENNLNISSASSVRDEAETAADWMSEEEEIESRSLFSSDES